MGLAIFSAEPSSGGIAARGEQTIELTLSTYTLGRVQLPVRIKIIGSKNKPLEFAIAAKSLGPDLLFGASPDEKVKELAISYGRVAVLEEHVYCLHLFNPCLIPAGMWKSNISIASGSSQPLPWQSTCAVLITTCTSLQTSSCSLRAKTAYLVWSPEKPAWKQAPPWLLKSQSAWMTLW